MPVAESRAMVAGVTAESDRLQELQRRIEELTEAVAARDTFIAVAAHELRNPMTPIIGQVDLLLARVRAGRCTPKQVEQRLERIQRTVRHYVKRAAVLLDVSRMTSGRLQLEPEPLDLSLLLHEVVADFADAAQRAGVTIAVTAADGISGSWDRLAMEQIIDNLLSNALKYGGQTPVELSATVEQDRVCIVLRDHGPGVPLPERARIFQRFERAVGRGERRTGFGVGLWLVRQLVEAMDGAIELDDAPGGGARFTLRLPRQAEGTRN